MESLQSRAINRLKELGANKDQLWLVEVQTIEQAADFYGDYVKWDLCKNSPDEDTHIIYYHESGSIHQHGTFSKDDPESFEKAIKWIARYLGADLLYCNKCNSFDISKGEMVEGDQLKYNICNNCGKRWQDSENGQNVII